MAEIQMRVRDSLSIAPILNHARELIEKAIVRGEVVITLGRPKRTLDQNALLWPLLTDISKQVTHFGHKYTPDDWKSILTAAFEKQIRTAPNLDGTGLIFLGTSTRKMSKAKFSEFLEFIFSEGAERGVKWSMKSTENYSEMMK